MVFSVATALDISDRIARPPFPKRGATLELERRVVDYLRRERPAPGSPLGTDQALVEVTRLSRSTVRRVMERLDRDGWVDRHAGRGTFVGERVLLLDDVEAGPAAMADAKHDADERAIRRAVGRGGRPADARPDPARGTLRVAVLISRIEDLSHDWFSLGVIAGLDAAAAERGGQIELIGTREARPDVLADRLARARPDALAYLAWRPQYLALLDVGRRLGFPTIFGKTTFARPDWAHSVCEDNDHAVELAVEALWSAGHRKIALAINRWPEPWVLERHRAFEEALRRRGVDLPERPTAWLDSADDPTPANVDRNNEAMADRLGRYLALHRPTALLSASQVTSDVLGRLVRRRGGPRLPDDLSVCCIDQPPDLVRTLGVEPTVVRLPLAEIGRGLFEAAETLAGLAGGAGTEHLARRVPCRLHAGASIRALGR